MIIFYASHKKQIEVIRNSLTSNLSKIELQKVIVVDHHGLIEYLNSTLREVKEEDYIKGWRIKLEFQEMPNKEATFRINTIKRVLAKFNKKERDV